MARELHHRKSDDKYALYSTIIDDYITEWDSKEVIRSLWLEDKIEKAIQEIDKWMEKVDKEVDIQADDDIPSPYCPVCNHCGETGCCGVEGFLEKHVRGKTSCMHEDQIIDEIKEFYEYYKGKRCYDESR